jgi:predicted ATPase
MNNNYFIITGAMGSGKSTLLHELHKEKFVCVDEPARKILKEQRNIHGPGTPEQDPNLFCHLLLSRSITLYEKYKDTHKPVIFDRGIPDNIGYADFFKVNNRPFINASNQHRYHKQVFFLPAWKEIYHTDDERKMSYEQSDNFGNHLRKVYTDLGYELVEVPVGSPSFRSAFVLERLK